MPRSTASVGGARVKDLTHLQAQVDHLIAYIAELRAAMTAAERERDDVAKELHRRLKRPVSQ